jgi:tetratricopeptide (TPR) repeat protein
MGRKKPVRAKLSSKKPRKHKDNVNELIEKGNDALSRLELEDALEYFDRAHKLSPNDTNIIDALADVHLQLGDHDAALQLLHISTTMAPTENPSKWFYLAQLQSGHDALSNYQRGIDLLTQRRQNSPEVSILY